MRSADWLEMNDQVADADLLRRARAGSEVAFRALVERYEPAVAATVIGMLGPGDEAEDVGQETFIRFYASLERFREESSLKTYLTRIAINLSLNALKRRKKFFARHVEGDSREATLFHAGAGPSGQVEATEVRERVRAAIDQLAAGHRAVVTLRLIDGYSTRETAEMLGLPEGTVLSRLSRALKKMEPHLRPLVEA